MPWYKNKQLPQNVFTVYVGLSFQYPCLFCIFDRIGHNATIWYMNTIYSKIIEVENSNKKAALCTIIATKGSAPRKTGSKMIVYENGKIDGTIGGGAL